jgi:hypothetical protein
VCASRFGWRGGIPEQRFHSQSCSVVGGEGWCVDGDVWISVREELVGVCRAGSSGPEVFEVLFKVRVFVVE